MEISLEKIIEIVTREVIKELAIKGIVIDSTLNQASLGSKTKAWTMDMSEFKTPVLTENMLASLDKGTSEIIIPRRTFITIGARDIIKRKKVTIIYKS